MCCSHLADTLRKHNRYVKCRALLNCSISQPSWTKTSDWQPSSVARLLFVTNLIASISASIRAPAFVTLIVQRFCFSPFCGAECKVNGKCSPFCNTSWMHFNRLQCHLWFMAPFCSFMCYICHFFCGSFIYKTVLLQENVKRIYVELPQELLLLSTPLPLWPHLQELLPPALFLQQKHGVT